MDSRFKKLEDKLSAWTGEEIEVLTELVGTMRPTVRAVLQARSEIGKFILEISKVHLEDAILNYLSKENFTTPNQKRKAQSNLMRFQESFTKERPLATLQTVLDASPQTLEGLDNVGAVVLTHVTKMLEFYKIDHFRAKI